MVVVIANFLQKSPWVMQENVGLAEYFSRACWQSFLTDVDLIFWSDLKVQTNLSQILPFVPMA